MKSTYIVSLRSVAEFRSENLEQLSSSPTLFAVSVVGEVVGVHLTETIFQMIRPGPRIAGSGDNLWRNSEDFSLFWFAGFSIGEGFWRLCDNQSHSPRI